MPPYKIGYARVSTLQQDEALQHDALMAAGCQRIFVDKASGKLDSRPALDDLLEQVRPGDTVVVWRLDRLGRSLRHLLETVSALERRGIGFVSLTENIDTSTPPGGRLVFHVFASLAEFEAALIRERTMAGLAAARARGRTGGRPTVWTEDKVRTAQAMRASGDYTVASIAKVLGVSRASVYRALDLPLLSAEEGASRAARAATAHGPYRTTSPAVTCRARDYADTAPTSRSLEPAGPLSGG